MTQEFLHGFDVHRVHGQMGGKGMPEVMVVNRVYGRGWEA